VEGFSGPKRKMNIALNGFKFGIVLAILVGPVFFTIIQTSIERGFWKGLIVALGVSVSDTFCVMIAYFGLSHLITKPEFRLQLAYIGGSILVLFALYYLFIKSRRNTTQAYEEQTEKPHYRYFFKGFVINGFSPSVIMFWVGTISIASVDFGYTEGRQFLLFFSALLVTVLATDIMKAYLAGKLRSFVTPRVLRIMNFVLGAVLLVFGARLILLAKSF